jgi:hypothetical protein
MTQVWTWVDITEPGTGRIGGPGFAGYVATVPGKRTSVTHRPTYSIMLTDDTEALPEAERAPGEPMPPVTRCLRTAFSVAAVEMARRLAKHYGYADVEVTLHDETRPDQLSRKV